MAAQLLVQLVVLMLTKPWQRDPMKVWHKDQTKNCCCKSLLLSIYIDIKSRWRHNWKSAQVVNSHLVRDPTIRQPGFDLPRQQWSLLNRFRTEQDTAVPAEGNGDLQTLICVLVARPRRCLTLSNPVP